MSHGASSELEGYLKPSQTSTRQHSCENSELFHRKKSSVNITLLFLEEDSVQKVYENF